MFVAAADALARLGPAAKDAAPALARKLDHVQPWVRTAAMNALQAMGEAAVPTVLEVFDRGPVGARRCAAIVLGAIGPAVRPAIPALKKALAAAGPDQRGQLVEILAAIESAESAPPRGPSEKIAPPALLGPSEPRSISTRDWPQFHGPRRDNLCDETGLLQQWPAGGPRLLWKLEGLGKGYSTVSIAADRLFTMGDRATRRARRNSFWPTTWPCKPLWAARVGPPHEDGPRCTPTVDGKRLYALGTEGDLVCLETATGKPLWQRNLVKDFGGRMMTGWKYSESPLVDGDRLVCTPGGPDAALVALDKRTGREVWKATVPELGDQGRDGAAYSSPVAAEIAGLREIVQVLGRGVVGVDAATGRFLWSYNRLANRTANITHAIVRGDFLFVTNSYQTGSALLRIVRSGETFRAEEVYFLDYRKFENHHGGVVLVGDYVYGGSGQNRGDPVSIELATGKIAWARQGPFARFGGRALCRRPLDLSLRPRTRRAGRGHARGVPRERDAGAAERRRPGLARTRSCTKASSTSATATCWPATTCGHRSPRRKQSAVARLPLPRLASVHTPGSPR